MKVKYLPASPKTAWQNNAPFVLLLLSLLAILSLLKIIFYNYNYHFIFTGSDEINTWGSKIKLIKWSLLNDTAILLLINAPLLLLLQAARYFPVNISRYIIVPVFVLLNSFVILLNLADIFYFPFHFQRANADLLFVLNHPFKQLFHLNIFIILAFFISIFGIIFLTWKLYGRFFSSFAGGKRCNMISIIFLLGIFLLPFYKNSLSKFLVPAYPLVELNSRQLMIVQNSAHSFAYSLFRSGQELPIRNYMSVAECDALFPIKKTVLPYNNDSTKKNIVLFIMESVPYDFFDTTSTYKVSMPFFDSLLQKSTFYNNAFCYAHQSNKGIVAILAGIPTFSDIPVYHSSFINMPVTPIGNALKKNNYHSFFCIGDDYDNFGFAKCCNWLGIGNYYSKENIPGYKDLPMHTMGVQDEYVLDFMHNEINQTASPFFAVNYNISTHYPYDLPPGFKNDFPSNYTNPMKSMSYYDQSLQKFFTASKKEPWFSNTVFIFCSDHWLVPDDTKTRFNAISGYRIPIIIYDPAISKKEVNEQLVSQFDVMGTILSIGGYKDSIISYGTSLFEKPAGNKVVFSKANASLYQVTDSAYILGFNISNDKVEFLYNYKKDTALQQNLLTDKTAADKLAWLTLRIKAFIQKGTLQYNRIPFE